MLNTYKDNSGTYSDNSRMSNYCCFCFGNIDIESSRRGVCYAIWMPCGREISENDPLTASSKMWSIAVVFGIYFLNRCSLTLIISPHSNVTRRLKHVEIDSDADKIGRNWNMERNEREDMERHEKEDEAHGGK